MIAGRGPGTYTWRAATAAMRLGEDAHGRVDLVGAHDERR